MILPLMEVSMKSGEGQTADMVSGLAESHDKKDWKDTHVGPVLAQRAASEGWVA
jgi:hypothetical protein